MAKAARAPSILLATPCFGGLAGIGYVESLLRLQSACAGRGVALEVDLTGGEALITRARSLAATRFLEETDHTHLLFVDADIGFEPEHVFRLLAADKDLVGGVYPTKRINWDKVRAAVAAGRADLEAASSGYVVQFIPSPTNSVDVNDAGFGPVAYVGTGFLLIRRTVLEQVRAANPALQALVSDVGQPPRTAALLFETMIDPDTGRYLSEDYAFCRRWRDCGGEVWADFKGRLTHTGHAAYSGSLMDAKRRE
jgi:hypothetical protein